MNLFRSEEHVRRWDRFDPDAEEGIIALEDLVELFSGPFFRRRLDPDWLSRRREYGAEMVATMRRLRGTDSFWQPVKP